MLTVQVYQAKDLPAADAQGSSDPFAVVRCGRAQAKTHVCQATSNPGWFKEMLMQVDLPLMPRARRRAKRGDVAGVDDGEKNGEENREDDEESSEGSGSETAESDVENGGGMGVPWSVASWPGAPSTLASSLSKTPRALT